MLNFSGRKRNKFASRCWTCGRHLRPEEGYLDGRSDGGYWIVRCDGCLGIEPDGPYVGERQAPTPPPRREPPKRTVVLPECMTVLGLTPPVDRESIKRAYRAKVMQAHPDHGGSTRSFLDIQAAYERSMQLIEVYPSKWR